MAGIKFVKSEAGEFRRASLWRRVSELRHGLGLPPGPISPIVPIILGPEAAALGAAARLRDAGIFAPAIRYPTVPRGKARLRITLSAAHTAEQVTRLVLALKAVATPPDSATP